MKAIQEEFWLQGDREAAMGIMVSPMCDRRAGERIGQSQAGAYTCSRYSST